MTITTGTRVVILGGTSGIGLATAKAAVVAGTSVVVASRKPTSVASALAELPGTAEGYAVDASSSAALVDFFGHLGTFDHFVYTAGDNLVPATLDTYTPEQGRAFLELRVVRAGTAAYRGGTGWFLGSAASGAIISAARSLAVELAPIRVNVVAPGVVRSPLWAGLPDTERETMFHALGEHLPSGRIAEVEDVAKAFLNLMNSDYVTGTVSVVDGGALAG
jgi:NAD(P)-dependent dehydrogenase (short-subunit alcohol dehydrogenase family)